MWRSGDYTYDGAGNIVTIGTPSAPGTQGYRTYGYDSLSRLQSAQIGGVASGVTYGYEYDVYGNRIGSTMNQQSMATPAVNAATNRLDGTGYDASGNQTTNGTSAATWDGFAMMTSYRFGTTTANTNIYVYTANDERIGLLRGSEWTWTLRGPDGKPLRQFRSSTAKPTEWSWVEDFVYRDGSLLASERSAGEGGLRHYHLDHLGSARLVTSAMGTLLSEHDFLPFGGERTEIGQHTSLGFSREEPLRYTGHERDFEITEPNDSSAYIDYMHARYYGPNTGRFLSVDPSTKFDLHNPQAWNRYSYAHNNPLLKVDPDGRDALAVTYVGYRVQTPIGRRPLGHSGITIVQGSGRTSYYEFGRYRPGGEVRRLGVPDLVMKNGVPTRESLKAHMSALSQKAGQGLPVSGAYFTNDTAAQMQAFAEERKQDSSKQGTYGLLTNNCATFCEDVLRAGGEKLDEALNNTPENVMQELQDRSEFDVHYDPKKDELTVTCREGAACPP